MTTKVNVMVSLEVNRRGEGVEDDYQSECDGESGKGGNMGGVNRRGKGVEDDYQSECDGESGG